jgi:hypothetical protein
MEPKTTYVSSFEIGALVVKHNGLIRLSAIVSAFMFWYLTAIVVLVLCTTGVLPYSSLLSFGQVVSAIGLIPIPVAVATWRVFEWAYGKYLTGYARKYFQL